MTPGTSTRGWPDARATDGVIAVMLTVTALWIAFGHFQFGQHADSLIPVLVSLQHWTPYYWAQDRYGMLIPLLTAPLHNPLTNMMVQSAIGIFAAMSAGFFLVQYFFQDSPIWLVAAALQNIWILLLVSKVVQFEWFVDLPYAPSMALGFAALVVASRGRRGVSLLLMLLSYWLNAGVIVVLLPIVLFRHLITRQQRGLVDEIGITLTGFAVGILGKNLSHAPRTTTGMDPISVWPSAWLQLLHHVRESSIERPSALWWMIVPAVLGIVVLIFSRRSKYPLLVAVSLMLAGLLNWLFVGTLVWVRLNLYGARYVFPSLFLFAMALAVLTTAPFQNAPLRYGRIGAVAMTLLIFVLGAALYGRPSRGRVQRDIDQRYGALTPDIVASHATLVAGNYWTMWPAVFDTNLMLYRRGEHRMVYGLGLRAEPTLLDWALQRSVCAAAPVGDPESEYWMNNSPRHFKYSRQINSIKLYCED